MNISRRLFLKNGGLAVASVGVGAAMGPLFLRRAAFAEEPLRSSRATGGRKVLICIFQRGAVDGLSMVAPHGDASYYGLRNTGQGGIALARTGLDGVIDLDGTFGLHPALAPLKPIYDAGHLAPIHACGSPNATRSHFDAQDYMESAAPGNKGIGSGWLARTAHYCPEDQARMKSLFKAVAMTGQVPRSLQGDADALAIADLRTFGIHGSAGAAAQARMGDAGGMDLPMRRRRRRELGAMAAGGPANAANPLAQSFEALYDQPNGDVVHDSSDGLNGTGQETFEALKILKKLRPTSYAPQNGAAYPASSFGTALQQIAQLIKADLGVEIAFAELGGWDTHVNQGSTQGRLAARLKDFGQGLAALYADLGDRMADVIVLTMSEFGRTARQNGNGGTDHGHGTCFFAMGGNVNGGKVLGQWPGLAPEQLYEQRDLAVTTDFRDVFGEVAQRHLGVRDLAAVFPGYQSSPARFRQVIRV